MLAFMAILCEFAELCGGVGVCFCFAVDLVRAVVTSLAGGVSGTNGPFVDGSGTNAVFYATRGVAVDATGNLYVADQGNQRIRKASAIVGGATVMRSDWSCKFFYRCPCVFVCACGFM
jgi:hypothetical protein